MKERETIMSRCECVHPQHGKGGCKNATSNHQYCGPCQAEGSCVKRSNPSASDLLSLLWSDFKQDPERTLDDLTVDELGDLLAYAIGLRAKVERLTEKSEGCPWPYGGCTCNQGAG